MGRKQNKREAWAADLERIVGPNGSSRRARANNKLVDKRKRAQFARSRAL